MYFAGLLPCWTLMFKLKAERGAEFDFYRTALTTNGAIIAYIDSCWYVCGLSDQTQREIAAYFELAFVKL